MNNNIITIDGPSGVGKGTLAKRIGATLGYANLDTGSLYRSITLHLFESGTDFAVTSDEDTVAAARKIIDNREILEIAKRPEIRGDAISTMTARVASMHKLRGVLKEFQQDFGLNPPGGKGAVIEGRDIGTEIFPNAPVKIYLDASLEVKARRRFDEYRSQGKSISYDEVFAHMKARDESDASRAHGNGRMERPADAVLIDTSDMTRDEVFDRAMSVINQKLPIGA